MIDSEQIRDLEMVVKYLNEDENPQKDHIAAFVKDPDSLFKVLSEVKPNNIRKKFISKKRGHEKESKYGYTQTEVEKLFRDTAGEDIVKSYSQEQLKAMYYAIYKRKPIYSRQTKKDIVSAITMYFHQIDRAKAFGND